MKTPTNLQILDALPNVLLDSPELRIVRNAECVRIHIKVGEPCGGAGAYRHTHTIDIEITRCDAEIWHVDGIRDGRLATLVRLRARCAESGEAGTLNEAMVNLRNRLFG